MTTTKTRTARKTEKSVLTATWIEPDNRSTRIARLSKGDDVAYYELTRIEQPTDDTIAYEFAEIQGGMINRIQPYLTLISVENPQDHTCTCIGHSYKGDCKHVQAIKELLND